MRGTERIKQDDEKSKDGTTRTTTEKKSEECYMIRVLSRGLQFRVRVMIYG